MGPFTDDKAASIAGLGEKALLREIRAWLGAAAPPAPTCMGDDCAVLPGSAVGHRLITTDSVVLGRHFEAATDPCLVGLKLLRRNLSDIAAMGGTPTEAVMAGLLPRNLRTEWLRRFTCALAEDAVQFGVHIVGGDLTETSQDLCLNLSLLGYVDNPLLRSGAHRGDWIGLTGAVGGSRLGRHLTITPRLTEGRLLAAGRGVTSCIDVSDGLAIDLVALIPDGSSACLDVSAIPVHADAVSMAEASGRTPLWHALNDGEDHELLFTFRAGSGNSWQEMQDAFAAAGCAPPRRIGCLVPRGQAAILDAATRQPLADLSGYDHFG